MKKNKQTIAKYPRLYAIGLWGILSIIWLSGEPIDDMALGKFCLLKGCLLYTSDAADEL